jgi:phosphoribosylanthranilate isomerase
MCAKANRLVWKAVSIKTEASLKEIEKYSGVDGILVDTYKAGSLGGNGETFNWDIVKGLSDRYFTILAGGLEADNINEAIETVKPQVVDVCSGVEINIIKDEEKIKNFVRRVQYGTK